MVPPHSDSSTRTSRPQDAAAGVRRQARLFDTERLLRAVGRLKGDRAFESEQDAAEFFNSFKGRSLESIQAELPQDDREEAQELAYQGLEATRKTEAVALAQKALALDGECTDAQVCLAFGTVESPRMLAKQLRTIVDRAEARLGTPFLREHRGELWGILEARPYLRARLALAEAYEKAGKASEAIPHLEELLKLNTGDHQGARYRLVRCYLAAGQLKPLAVLLKTREDEGSLFMAWAAVLERIKAKSEKGALKALERARELNPHVEEFLTGRRKLPKKPIETWESGTPEEAVIVLRQFGDAWLNDREAMYWLFKQGT